MASTATSHYPPTTQQYTTTTASQYDPQYAQPAPVNQPLQYQPPQGATTYNGTSPHAYGNAPLPPSPRHSRENRRSAQYATAPRPYQSPSRTKAHARSNPRDAKNSKSNTMKNMLVVFLGELVGTFLFLFMAFAGTQTALLDDSAGGSAGLSIQQLMYISLSFGFSLAVNAWLFFRITGGLFNPAVTVAFYVIGLVELGKSVVIFVAEILGAICASALVKGLLPGHEVVHTVQLGQGMSIAMGLFLEVFLTAQLVFALCMLAAEKTKSTFIAPIGIGLALFICMLVGTQYTGAALNPARAFGPAVIAGKFNGYHWIYWLGPVLGSLLATGFYKLMKGLRFEDVGGDQDKSGEEVTGRGIRKEEV